MHRQLAFRCAFACLGWAGLAAATSQEQPLETNLLLHLPFDGTARDGAAGKRPAEAVAVDLAAPGPTGAAGTAAAFDGRQSVVKIAHDPGLSLGAGDFTIALWLATDAAQDDAPGDLISKYDGAARRGLSLRLTSGSVTHSQSNFRQVHVGLDDGRGEPQWVDRGRPGSAVYVHGLTVYNGGLYAATCEPLAGQAGRVYRLEGRDQWVDCGAPDRCNAVTSLAVYRGRLYAGSGKYRLAGSALPESENANLGGRVFRYEGNRQWTDCGRLGESEAVGGLVVFRDALYASSLYRPAGFYRFEEPGRWKELATPGGKRPEALYVYNGALYASGYDEGHVYRYDGQSWTDLGNVGDNTQTYGFATLGGALYVSTWPSGRVYRLQGNNEWADCGRLGEELEVMGMAVYNGKLYAGTLPQAAVYRYERDGHWVSTGRLDQTPDVKYRRAWSMAEYQGQLFCGTLPSGRVYSLKVGQNVTYDGELPAGWHHLAATREGRVLRLFIDGEPAGESRAPETVNIANEAPLLVGMGPHDHFHGRLRDVRLYDRALGAAQIKALAEK
jgi:hypothetical protein